jgi:GNAT superfamily N-acetyltransferase
MTIREIRPDDVARVTDLYLEMCRRLSDRDAEWGVPEREPIARWIRRTTETDEAVCLVSEADGAISGYLLASVTPHPAMPGIVGTLEELHVSTGSVEARRALVEAGIAWARDHGARPIQTTVAVGSPWSDEELAFWGSMGFEHDQALVRRYFLEDDGC